MNLCLHLGAHKTATTHLQTAFDRAAPQLARQGIGWMGPRRLRAGPTDLRRLLDDCGRTPWKARQAARALRQESASAGRLILSDELILGDTTPARLFAPRGQLYPLAQARLENLVGLMDGSGIRLFLAVREPADFLISAFGEELRMGRQARIGDYLAGLDCARLGWSDLADRLLSVAGVESLVCWRHEDLGSVRPSVLARMAGPQAARLIPDPAPRRIGWSAAAYRDYLGAIAHSDTMQDRRQIAHRALESHPRGAGDAGLRAAIPAADLPRGGDYAEDCARLVAMTKVTFLSPSDASLQG